MADGEKTPANKDDEILRLINELLTEVRALKQQMGAVQRDIGPLAARERTRSSYDKS